MFHAMGTLVFKHILKMNSLFPHHAESVDKQSLLADFEAALPYINLLKKKEGLPFGPVRSPS